MISNLFRKKKQPIKLKNLGNKKIVCIGGGTGLFSLLSGLKEYTTSKHNIKVIVSTLDSGSSSGRLITQYGILPPGDARNCIVALSDETEILNKLFQYRFDDYLDKHNFGNLLITALTDVTGSFEEAIKVASRILRIRGEVIPVSLEKNDIVAELDNGEKIIGEDKIDTTPNKIIKEMTLNQKPKTNPRTLQAIEDADIIIFGPGDLYTSIIPNLLFPKIRKAINQNTKAKKILIANVMTKPGETDNFCVSNFKSEIEKYLKGNLTHVIANKNIPASLSLKEYQKENKHPVPVDENNISNCKIIKEDLIDETLIVRHDPQKLAKTILKTL